MSFDRKLQYLSVGPLVRLQKHEFDSLETAVNVQAHVNEQAGEFKDMFEQSKRKAPVNW
jgi:hypothetical protein